MKHLTENIRKIFDLNIELLRDMDRAVYYFRGQEYEKALALVANSVDSIKYTIEAIIQDREYFNLVNTESMLEMLSGILNAKKNNDFVLLADLLELQLINFLLGVQELIISKEVTIFDVNKYKNNIRLLLERGIGITEDFNEPVNTAALLQSGYRVEFTSCGLMTLAAENEGAKFYFHTNNRIQTEAFLLASKWYQEHIATYLIYGLGMGYHIKELCDLAPQAQIVIFETDRNVIQLACAFSELQKLLLNHRVKLIYDPELKQLQEWLPDCSAKEAFLVHYPSYKNIRKKELKKLLEQAIPWCKTIEAC